MASATPEATEVETSPESEQNEVEPTEPKAVEPAPEASSTTDASPAPQGGDAGEGEPDEPKATKGAEAELPKPIFTSIEGGCGRDPGVGTKLKSFELKNLEGEEVTNGRYRKRVMLLNFWGSWCKPCLKELPEFSRLYRRYRKAGMTLVAIATDEDPAVVKELADKRKIRARFLLGGQKYADSYEAPNFPFTFVVDTSGTIVGSYHGYKEECMGKLEDDIRTALQSK